MSGRPAARPGVAQAAPGGGQAQPAGQARRAPALLRAVTPSVHGAVDPAALCAEGVSLDGLVDFSSNQSPLGAAPGVAAAVAGAVVDAYPDPHATALVAAIAARHGVAAGHAVAGNGSTELIRLIAQLALGPGDTAVSLAPSFGEYEVGTRLAGARFAEVYLVHGDGDGGAGGGAQATGRATAGFSCDEPALLDALATRRPRVCWLCSPNNPTGAALPAALLAALVHGHPEILFVLDEAYCDLLAEPQWTLDLLAAGNLIVLHSMTKYWGLAGLRLGYALAAPELVALLRAAIAPWSINACAQAAGVAALADSEHHGRSVALLCSERDRLTTELRARGWTVEPTTAGFFLIRVGDAPVARRALLERGFLVRDCTSFGLPEHVRVSPRHAAQNDRLLQAFAGLTPPQPPQSPEISS